MSSAKTVRSIMLSMLSTDSIPLQEYQTPQLQMTTCRVSSLDWNGDRRILESRSESSSVSRERHQVSVRVPRYLHNSITQSC